MSLSCSIFKIKYLEILKGVSEDDVPLKDAKVACFYWRFYAFILITVGGFGSQINHHLFNLQMALRYKGLSRTGLALLYRLGLGISLSSMDTYMKSETAELVERYLFRCLMTTTSC